MDNNKKIKDNKSFWEVDKAVKRLIWRLSPKENGNYFKFEPNESDFNALKSILGSLDRNKKINIANNTLFAKLYIYHLTMNIRHFETTVLNSYPEKELKRMLDKPLEMFVQSFYNDLHNNQLNKLLKTENEKEQKDILESVEQLKKTYTLDYVRGKLFDSINKSLKTYS